MTNRNFWQLLLMVLLAGLIACQQSTPAGQQAPVTLPGTEIASGPDAATEAARQKILTILESYYSDLSAERIDASRYYTPVVTTFFNSQNLSREKVGESIRNGFAAVENRQIVIDPASLRVEGGTEGYTAEFDGTARFTRSADKEAVTDAFHNRLRFTADFLISAFESGTPTNTRSMSARSAGTDPEVLALATRVLTDLKAGTLSNSSYIHPRKGFFIIVRPGIYSIAYQHATLAEATDVAPGLKKGFSSLIVTPRQEALPEFNCGDLFSKQGSFIAPFAGRYDGISSLMQSLSEAEIVALNEENLAAARDIEQYVQVQSIDTAEEMSLFFGQIEGVWYLLVIDLASYDCSA